MMRTMLKSKISYATVTEAQLYYQGSITIDKDIMDKANILPHEKVIVLNLNNGARLETYAIVGAAGSGVICLNGPAARQGCCGDKIIILSYGIYAHGELGDLKTTFVELDERNKVRNTTMA